MSAPGLQAVEAVGGVVPPGLLARIQAGELTNRAGLDPKTYHLAGRETVRDAASRAWTYLRGAWTAWRDFTETQPPGTAGTGAARDRWLLVLLRELGYGQIPALPTGLIVDDREYPVSHAWQHVPIHLLGPGVDLDKRNPGVAGAARAPQTMLQELLNRSDGHLWAILSNGLRLRLLRDSTALAGSAYLEFDLESIFGGELYPEFLLLWQLCHVSRLEKREGSDASPTDCWLDAWRAEAVDAGTRALDRLRDGVEAALVHLGTGFLRHPSNAALVAALRDGTLATEQYHRALLRLVYRLLFVFVTEDRDALLQPLPEPTSPTFATATTARARYARYFSTARLRRLSRIRAGSLHGDLWQAQRLVFQALGDHGQDGLGLPALAGLFDPDPRMPYIPGLKQSDLFFGCELSNEDLLAAIRDLAWVELPGQRIQPVDYRNLGAEELGSVYESLLELVPQIELPERLFRLKRLAGNERKTTGSYYTPPSLVSALLDSALDPLMDEAVKHATDPADAEARLLALSVCDPACGSGHFLVAAARRIARRLAQVRCGEDEPTPGQVRHALRDVVGTCIYGVDINDLAADLAKVSLWMEALEPGKPLGFLDARVRVGNSLLGATPQLLADGVPDAAFKELEGDDKKYAAGIRKRNKASSGGQGMLLMGLGGGPSRDALVDARREAIALEDDVDKVRDQERHWQEFEASLTYLGPKLHADAWCSAFVWPLHDGTAEPPVDAIVKALEENSNEPGLEATVIQAKQLADEYRFFHWHLEFPEIFDADGNGGFRCVLGNPPWERINLREQEFFASIAPEIATAPSAAARKRLIATLPQTDPRLWNVYRETKRVADGTGHFVTASGRYPLTGRGDVNTYSIFAETFRALTGKLGRSGVIVPTGIATDVTTKFFFRDVVESSSLASLFDFENAAPLFVGVHRSFKFCILTMLGHGSRVSETRFAFFLVDPALIISSSFSMTPEEILLLSPNTGTCPIFRGRRDADITLGIYRRVPVLINNTAIGSNSWNLELGRMFHMSDDSHLFRNRDDLEAEGWVLQGNIFERDDNGVVKRMLPLYEGRMGHQYDHRYGHDQAKGVHSSSDPSKVAMPEVWVPEDATNERLLRRHHGCSTALLGHRRVARNTDERTCIAAFIPWGAASYGWILTTGPGAVDLAAIAAAYNSYVYDYCLRNSLTQASIPQSTSEQIPVPSPSDMDDPTPWDLSTSVKQWIRARVLELTYSSWDMNPFARDLGDASPPFVWEDERRELLRAELDAAFFHLYGVSAEDTDYILETFPIVKRKDGTRFGEYRTKRLILEIYDVMQKAIGSGVAYQTVLDPPPGQGPRHPESSEV
jgi:hypothetical protein